MLRLLGHWLHDYWHALRGIGNILVYREPPAHYLGHVVAGKAPVILIPGVYEKWQFLKAVADPISHCGHPVYALTHISYNLREIRHLSELVWKLIEQEELHNVVLLAHSKGGLVGKRILASHNSDGRVKKLIAIATPFSGSEAVRFLPFKNLSELHPRSATIIELNKERSINRHIVSIFGEFDNHVWPTESCRLEGAKNIQVPVHGHHRILFDNEVRELVMAEIEMT
ncbi:MAG: hypothetical protein AAB686_01300 [Patescibacteria group bacterium]